MLNTIDGPSESVEDYLCDPELMPLGARESRLPCPEDCVLNDWGPWSRCDVVRAEGQSESSSRDASEVDLDVFFPTLMFPLRLEEFKAEPQWIIGGTRYFVIHQGGKKDVNVAGKDGFCIAYIILYSLCIQRGRHMIYDEDSEPPSRFPDLHFAMRSLRQQWCWGQHENLLKYSPRACCLLSFGRQVIRCICRKILVYDNNNLGRCGCHKESSS